MTTARKCSRSAGRTSRNGRMSGISRRVRISSAEQLTLLPEDSLASLSVLPGSEKARQMTATSGRKCSALYPRSGRLGCLLKMLLEASDLSSPLYFLTWKAKAMKRSRLFFQLMLSEPRTGETGSGLWPTPVAQEYGSNRSKSPNAKRRPSLSQIAWMWPTPKAMDAERGSIYAMAKYNEKTGRGDNLGTAMARSLLPTPKTTDGKSASPGDFKRNDPGLRAMVKILATPQARDFRTGQRQRQRQRWNNPRRTRNLNDQIGGQLNPAWVEWLMGCPVGWTDLKVLGTAKSFFACYGLQKK